LASQYLAQQLVELQIQKRMLLIQSFVEFGELEMAEELKDTWLRVIDKSDSILKHG